MANSEHHSSESRRTFFKGVAATAAGISVVASAAEARPQKPVPSPAKLTSSTLITRDGTVIYYKDWGTGPAVVLSHGYPLSSDAWEDQMIFLSQNGYRVIAHDRRGFGRSNQPAHGYDFDTFSDDLAELVEALDLKDATFVGHSMGGGEVARYISRHGHHRVARAAFIGAVPPLMVKTPGNPNGIPKEVFDGIRQAIQADRSQFYRDVTLPYYNYDRPGANVSEGVRDNFWRQGMATGMLAGFFCIGLFSETDFTEDLKIINVPTLVIHGSDDQIVPIEISGSETAKLVKNAKLIVYEGASHGLIITHKDRINADLLAFLKS